MNQFIRLTFAAFMTLNLAACGSDTVVVIKTNYGDIKIKLYDETPLHTENFIKLVEQGFYDSLLFHRVINGFMIQGGDPNSRNAAPQVMLGSGDVGYTIPNEFDSTVAHKRGALAAARGNDPNKATSGCQFYIVQAGPKGDAELNAMESQSGKKFPAEHREIYKTVGGTPHLWLMEFTVFGEVIEGMDVVDKIAAVQTNRALGDRPVEDVRMFIEVIKG